jgi:SAM-dependent methyltransferase
VTLLDRAALRSVAGERYPLDVGRWFAAPSVGELEVLSRARAPVLDIGCGPARHVLALAGLGVEAVGIDVSASVVRAAAARGARVVRADVFGIVPSTGRWATALLLDGNVGIGGDPAALLSRVRDLLRRGGRVLVELGPPGTGSASSIVRVEAASSVGPWFPWARLAVDDVQPVADGAGLRVAERWTSEGRWFARLDR